MIARTIYLAPCAPTQCEALFVEGDNDGFDFAMCSQEALVYAQEFALDYPIPMCAKCLGILVQTPVVRGLLTYGFCPTEEEMDEEMRLAAEAGHPVTEALPGSS